MPSSIDTPNNSARSSLDNSTKLPVTVAPVTPLFKINAVSLSAKILPCSDSSSKPTSCKPGIGNNFPFSTPLPSCTVILKSSQPITAFFLAIIYCPFSNVISNFSSLLYKLNSVSLPKSCE